MPEAARRPRAPKSPNHLAGRPEKCVMECAPACHPSSRGRNRPIPCSSARSDSSDSTTSWIGSKGKSHRRSWPSTSSPDSTQLEALRRYQTSGGFAASVLSSDSPNQKAEFASAPSASSARDCWLFSHPSKGGLIGWTPMTAGSADEADATDGSNRLFSCCAHRDHSCPCAAFPGKRDLDPNAPQESLRPP